MKEKRVPPEQTAKNLIDKVGKESSLEIISVSIETKKQEKPTALSTMSWVEEMDYLQEVKSNIENYNK